MPKKKKSKRSLILYSSLNSGPGTKSVSITTQDGKWTPFGVAVRAELFEGDIAEALDAAQPRKGETVLNSIPFDVRKSADG